MNNIIEQILYIIPVVLLSLSFHEFSHAFVSYKLGDPTAKNLGRLTLNPLSHLDPLGTILIIISSIKGFGIGWAKPVPINPSYYRNPRNGTMISSLAGPVSNLLLAFIFAFPYTYIRFKYVGMNNTDDLLNIFYNFSYLFVVININLAVFNILPIPPLDGSKILSGVLPPRQYFKLMEYENYIGIIFLIIMFAFPWVLSSIMSPITEVIGSGIIYIVKTILFA